MCVLCFATAAGAELQGMSVFSILHFCYYAVIVLLGCLILAFYGIACDIKHRLTARKLCNTQS